MQLTLPPRYIHHRLRTVEYWCAGTRVMRRDRAQPDVPPTVSPLDRDGLAYGIFMGTFIEAPYDPTSDPRPS